MNANANLPQAADANAVQNDPPFPSNKKIILPNKMNPPVSKCGHVNVLRRASTLCTMFGYVLLY